MKLLNLKSILMLVGFFWVALSFFWFTQKQTQESLALNAENNLGFAQLEFQQKSNDLKFKLGQWGYNYNLVKTKGSDFDHDSFANSDFESIYFFKLVNEEFKPQWSKSKDLSVAAIPRSIKAKIKTWTKEKISDQDYIYFSDDPSPNGSKVFFGFMIKDDSMGEGLLLSSLDLNYVQLIGGNLNTYLVDPQGRFLVHPNREYVGQSASKWLRSENSENMITKSVPSKIIRGDFIYKQKIPTLLSKVLMPSIVMCLGLILIFGVLIFDIYIMAPLRLTDANANLIENSDQNLKIANVENENYKLNSKLIEMREALNKMSLLSSALKGRLDLATVESADATLISDIKNDFEELDQMLDEAYKSILNDSLNSTVIGVNSVSEGRKKTESNDASSRANSISRSVSSNSNSHGIPTSESPMNNIMNTVEENKNTQSLNIHNLGLDLQNSLGEFNNDDDEFNFEIALEEFDLDGVIESDEDLFEDEDYKNSELESTIADSPKVGSNKGVVFQEYVGSDLNAEIGSNDWAKIIEELTDEINNAPLKASKDAGTHGA